MSSPKKLKSNSQQSKTRSSGIEDLQDFDFTRKSRWTDLQLQVEGKVLYVPKSHLALVSPVFRRMFESDFKEKDLDVLPLPDKKYEDVLTFLKCTHPGALLKISYDVISKVLPQAHEYQVKWLLDDCTNVMLMEIDDSKFPSRFQSTYCDSSTTTFVSKCCNICVMAEKYGLKCVIERFIQKFSVINYKFYNDLSEFNEISIQVRYRIVCGRLFNKEEGIRKI